MTIIQMTENHFNANINNTQSAVCDVIEQYTRQKINDAGVILSCGDDVAKERVCSDNYFQVAEYILALLPTVNVTVENHPNILFVPTELLHFSNNSGSYLGSEVNDIVDEIISCATFTPRNLWPNSEDGSPHGCRDESDLSCDLLQLNTIASIFDGTPLMS